VPFLCARPLSPSRRAIPRVWHRCGTRQGILEGSSNGHVRHPTGAMLNYGYSCLDSEVRISILAAGLDPEIGYLHSNRKGRMSLIYDLMEPLRSVVDLAILNFVKGQLSHPMTSCCLVGVCAGCTRRWYGGSWKCCQSQTTLKRPRRLSSLRYPGVESVCLVTTLSFATSRTSESTDMGQFASTCFHRL
jgi:hypothetical protein